MLHYLPGSHHQLFKNVAAQIKFISEKVQEHQQSLDVNDPRDFIDYFLIKMEKVEWDLGFPPYIVGNKIQMNKKLPHEVLFIPCANVDMF